MPLVLARFPGLLADALSTFAIPVLIYSQTHDAQLSGLAFTLQWLPRIFLLPIIGAVVNQFDARRQLVLSDLTRAALCLVLAALPGVGPLIAVGCLLMLLDSHATIASETILATRVGREAIPVAQSGLQTQTQITRTTGPAAAGLLLGMGIPPLTFGITAVIFAVGGLGTAWVLRRGQMVLAATGDTPPPATATAEGAADGEPDGAPGRPPGILRNLTLGARALMASAALRRLLTYALIVNLVGGGLLALIPPLAIGYFRSTASVLGVVLGVASAGSIGAGALLGFLVNRRPGLRLWLAFLPLLAVAAAGMCAAPSITAFGAAFGLWSGGITVFNVWLRGRRIALIPPAEFGRTVGFFTAAMLAAVPIGGMVLAVLGGVLSPMSILRLITIVSAVALTILLGFSRLRRATV